MSAYHLNNKFSNFYESNKCGPSSMAAVWGLCFENFLWPKLYSEIIFKTHDYGWSSKISHFIKLISKAHLMSLTFTASWIVLIGLLSLFQYGTLLISFLEKGCEVFCHHIYFVISCSASHLKTLQRTAI